MAPVPVHLHRPEPTSQGPAIAANERAETTKRLKTLYWFKHRRRRRHPSQLKVRRTARAVAHRLGLAHGQQGGRACQSVETKDAALEVVVATALVLDGVGGVAGNMAFGARVPLDIGGSAKVIHCEDFLGATVPLTTAVNSTSLRLLDSWGAQLSVAKTAESST
ncbi:hypothetical protein G7Y89_g2123 [Cudoniella acicularis]|uniref:Uncharacterized protein n=1 Tax=Cudoniella acicularis TaxID=354080 RepID=A0A8H4W6D6_9HELO|nr:hypothetical protein G7Y89_g2123 [Cudoniella acicularis]